MRQTSAIRRLGAGGAERDGASNEARSLRGLRDRLLASMPGSHARRAEADAEAVIAFLKWNGEIDLNGFDRVVSPLAKYNN